MSVGLSRNLDVEKRLAKIDFIIKPPIWRRRKKLSTDHDGWALPFRGLVAMSSPEPFNGIVRL